MELYKRNLQFFLWLFIMDFASRLNILAHCGKFNSGYDGFLVLSRFSMVLNLLTLFLMFDLGLKLLQFTWHGKGFVHFLCDFREKSCDRRNGLSTKRDLDNSLVSKEVVNLNNEVVDDVCDTEFSSHDEICDVNKLESERKDNFSAGEELVNFNHEVIDDDCDKEFCSDDEECDVMILKRLVKIERLRAKMAYAEVEKERMAATSAAEEAMAMILRLQREKSSIEIEASQYRRLAEQKQEYDQEVIQSLQWIIMKNESERSELEETLRLCREKLKLFMNEDEVDRLYGFNASRRFLDPTTEYDLGDEVDNLVDAGSSVFVLRDLVD